MVCVDVFTRLKQDPFWCSFMFILCFRKEEEMIGSHADWFTCCLNWDTTAFCCNTLKSHLMVFIVWISLKNDRIWKLILCFIPKVTCSVLFVGVLSVSSLLCNVFFTTWGHTYIYVCIRGGTVHVFVPNRHGTGISVRCMMSYVEYRQFTPNPEGGARSNAMLFDNCQQKNSECQRWHRGGRADVWLTVFYFDKVPTGCQVSNTGTDVCVRVRERVCACECVRVRACDAITSTVSLYQQNQL